MLQTTKMFVNYSGTLAQFKEANLAEKYNKSIVFIGNGEAVYTHGKYYGDVKDALASLTSTVEGLKYFSGVKVGEQTATAAGKDGVLTLIASDPASIAVNVDTNGVTIGLTEAFVSKVNKVVSDLATEITNRENADAALRRDLGAKADTADAEGSAFARIAQLKSDIESMTGGNGSISEQISAAIKALDVDATEGDYISKISQVDGKIVAETGTFNFDTKGSAAAAENAAKAYADGLKTTIETNYAAADANTLQSAKSYADGLAVNYDAAGAAAGALKDAKDYTDEKVTEINGAAATLAGRVTANEQAIATLNGTDSVDGSVAKQVKDAINSFANELSDDNTVNTFKELVQYAASHDSEYTTLAGNVQSNTNAITTLNGTAEQAGSVAKAVKDAVDAEAAIARAAEKANADAIKGIKDDYLTSTDKNEVLGAVNTEKNRAEGVESGLDTRLTAVEGDYLKGADKTALQNSINTLSQTVTDNSTAATTGINEAKAAAKAADDKAAANAEAIAAMDMGKVEGIITSIVQVDGKVTATASSTIAAEKVTIADNDDNFASDVTTVESALIALANMWAWDEQ